MKRVVLHKPVKMGDKEHTVIEVREPTAGELMHINLNLLQMGNAQEVANILPRITEPMLTPQAVGRLSLADIAQFSNIVMGFLFPDAVAEAEAAVSAEAQTA